MVYIRGQKADYESWKTSGATGRGYDDVMPFFRRCEDNERFCNEYHGVGGPLVCRTGDSPIPSRRFGSRPGSRPDVQYCFMPGAGIDEGVDGVPGGDGCILNICQTRPHSVGPVELRSADPLAFPKIHPNYLKEPRDVDTMAEAVEFGRDVMHRPARAKEVRNEHVPSEPLLTKDADRQFVRQEAHAALHPVGTCRIGIDELGRLRVPPGSSWPHGSRSGIAGLTSPRQPSGWAPADRP